MQISRFWPFVYWLAHSSNVEDFLQIVFLPKTIEPPKDSESYVFQKLNDL